MTSTPRLGKGGVPNETIACAWCGTTAEGAAPATWSMQTSERGVQMVCQACTRANLRAIEAKLGGEWW